MRKAPLLLLTLAISTVALANDELTEREFKIRREALEARYHDFLVYLNELDKAEANESRFASEQRELRLKQFAEYEKAREEQVRERKAKKEHDPSAFEAELKEQDKKYEEARRRYVQKQAELKKLTEKSTAIPEDIEYGLYLYDFNEDSESED
jgi:hypothetical protein